MPLTLLFPINLHYCLVFWPVLFLHETQTNKILNQCQTNGNSANIWCVTTLERGAVWPFLCCCSAVFHSGLSALKPTGSPLTFLWHFTVWMWRPLVWRELSYLQGPTGYNHHLSLYRLQPENGGRGSLHAGCAIILPERLICCLSFRNCGGKQSWDLVCCFLFATHQFLV